MSPKAEPADSYAPDERRVQWCRDHGIDPFEQCADGPCEAWMLVTDAELDADAPREEYPDHGPTDPWQTSGPNG